MSQRWYRLEPSTSSTQIERGLQARLADPLWLMARQWQFGEFHGEDAATPVSVEAEVDVIPVTHCKRLGGAGNGRPVDPSIPLEATIEAEPLNPFETIAAAASAGAEFLRRLDSAGLQDLRPDLVAAFPLRIDAALLSGLPAAQRSHLLLLSRHGVDGAALYRSRPDRIVGIAGDRPQAKALQAQWADWRDNARLEAVSVDEADDSWVPERFEYAVSLTAKGNAGTVHLNAAEYHGGHLDWYAFDAKVSSQGGSRSAMRAAALKLKVTPTPIQFRGMPASRFWEFEDASIYFGDIAARPTDLARMVVAEFATVFGDDWFLVPIRVPTGNLARIGRFDVWDSFGRRHVLDATAVKDRAVYGTGRPWRFFELSGPDPAKSGSPWLALLPTLASAMSGTPVERTSLFRDETANMAWAIEEIVEGPLGASVARKRQWEAVKPEAAEAEPGVWKYRLSTLPPPHWIPFLPERRGEGPDVGLRRGRFQEWQDLPPHLVGPRGRLLVPDRPLTVFEEEIPRGGIEVVRHWQMARSHDGSPVLWRSRQKRPGSGERDSRLVWDSISSDETD